MLNRAGVNPLSPLVSLLQRTLNVSRGNTLAKIRHQVINAVRGETIIHEVNAVFMKQL